MVPLALSPAGADNAPSASPARVLTVYSHRRIEDIRHYQRGADRAQLHRRPSRRQEAREGRV